ncbi:MAG: hypothetical protein WCO63_05560 [Bacteroidota bacterium]
MNTRRILGLIFLLVLFLGPQSYSQSFIKKIQNKAEDEAIKKMFNEDKKKDKNTDPNASKDQADPNAQKSSGKKSVQNTEGGGMSNTPPDVLASIKSAKTAYEAKNYGDARFAVRQAIQGVELEIGKNILKTLPDRADGLPKEDKEDLVTSTGSGFAGLTIQRVYRTDNKELTLSIMNDAPMLMGINMYLNNPGVSSNDSENKVKQIQFNEYRGVLQYDQSSGYTVSVPFGQASLFVVKGVNYKNENDILNAAKLFDLNKIKTELGEK